MSWLPEKVKLVHSEFGYAELDFDVTWVRDAYTYPIETLMDCCVCLKDINDDTFFTCLDGGDTAHNDCTEILS